MFRKHDVLNHDSLPLTPLTQPLVFFNTQMVGHSPHLTSKSCGWMGFPKLVDHPTSTSDGVYGSLDDSNGKNLSWNLSQTSFFMVITRHKVCIHDSSGNHFTPCQQYFILRSLRWRSRHSSPVSLVPEARWPHQSNFCWDVERLYFLTFTLA